MRSILSIFAGLFAGFLIILGVEEWSHQIYPLPPGVDLSNKEGLQNLMLQIPIGALLMILLAYALGSLGAGMVTSTLAKAEAPLKKSLICGAILLIGGLSNLIMIPHPLWFAMLSTLLYLPMAYAGHQVAERWLKKN